MERTLTTAKSVFCPPMPPPIVSSWPRIAKHVPQSYLCHLPLPFKEGGRAREEGVSP
ncbi:Hypothetical protein FKW44_018093 [Caligus rogercresseyi]|uniref:Uncharacterized protein n=1 Tax=Caligus rogercresseyi TaxID=217165 RepID=A0A7T8GU10_CALRO|nr:Hypothetical protein FKW44_018093 [Caligus rogercresseyi]